MKKLLVGLMCFVLLLTSSSLSFAVSQDEGVYAGISWAFKKGVLSFEGNGYIIEDYNAMWPDYNPEVKELVFGKGIMGHESFVGFEHMEKLHKVTFENDRFDGMFTVSELIKEVLYTSENAEFRGITFVNSRLEKIYFLKANHRYKWEGNILYNADKTVLLYYRGSKKEKIVIPEGVKIIGDGAFANSKIISVELPSTLEEIGNYAFSGCTQIKSIEIPASCKKIFSHAFFNCKSLKDIVFHQDKMDFATYINTRRGKHDTLGYTFSLCTSLTEIIVPSCAKIPLGFFANCKNLKKVVFSEGNNPFVNCTFLKNIIVSPNHPSLEVIDGVLISKADKRLVCYPAGLTEENFEIPQGVRIIGDDAFFYCESLVTVTIPDSVLSIGERAFSYCKSLASIMIPDSVTSIGNYAFDSCGVLTSIVIPDSVTSIGDNPFQNCEALSNIIVSLDHPALAVKDGVLYSKPDKRLVCYPCTFEEMSFELPQGVRIIGHNAFYANYSLSFVTIPDSVMNIEDDAFCGCASLESITIPNSVVSIGNKAFSYCTALKSITIPDSVTSIADRAFINCRHLASITIPASVTVIGKEAFEGCDELTVTVTRDSYAAEYCKENGLKYNYTDSDDWLKD